MAELNGSALDSVVEEDPVATLTLPGGQTIALPLLKDASGGLFVDIRRLQPSTGICTYDPGFTSTASCDSSITYIDGSAGKLLYRGYPIEQLAERGDFFDSAYLLLHGELPSKLQKRKFEMDVKRSSLVHDQLIQFYKGFKHDAHPMAIMVGVVGALSAFYPLPEGLNNASAQLGACVRLIAKMPTLAALAYKTAKGLPVVYPRNDLSYAENLLYMMHALPTEPYQVDPVTAKALETILILHMDHEQNASTSTVRTAGSSQANPFACIASGVAALWGPAHGGANEAVLRMLAEIGTKDRIPEYIARAKDKNDSFRLMGFGHRVYKTYDPRSRIMRKICEQVLESLGSYDDPLLEIAEELERIAVNDEYFVKRNLYPNVDFYSGIVLHAIGIPISMFTVIFAVARTVGWVSQWREMMSEDAAVKITRPRQMYNGKLERNFVPLARRGDNLSPTSSLTRGSSLSGSSSLPPAPAHAPAPAHGGGAPPSLSALDKEREVAMLEETALYGPQHLRMVSAKFARVGI